ncbi:MAG: alpha/beta hydrolase [Candidatus Zipacnadales bacterium]
MIMFPLLITAMTFAAELPTFEAVHFHPRGDEAILLQGVLHRPVSKSDTPLPALVMCHPDPTMGGTMNDAVVVSVVSEALNRGFVVLRFDFRGVAASSVGHELVKGTVEDVLGALDFLAAQPGVEPNRLYLAGYSFGAVMALKTLQIEDRVQACVTVALPYSGKPHEREELREITRRDRPIFIVIGNHDEYGNPQAIREFFAEKQIEAYVHVITEADHFFRDPPTALMQVATSVAEFLEKQARQNEGDP